MKEVLEEMEGCVCVERQREKEERERERERREWMKWINERRGVQFTKGE